MRLMLDRGYTIVATDYVGMGTDGPDSYLVGDTGGICHAGGASRGLVARTTLGACGRSPCTTTPRHRI
ncbi:MAG: hypothetical protein LBE44_06720 [Microbacterium hominis]|nr:hypothetical protein [Microbacterium hominis]